LVKLSDTSRLIDRLVKNEWVTRNLNKNDGRAVDIFINEKGLALLKTIDEAEPQMLKIMQNISQSELAQLSTLLERLRG
jgi:DNA-binding MarR family transcriptional regulator